MSEIKSKTTREAVEQVSIWSKLKQVQELYIMIPLVVLIAIASAFNMSFWGWGNIAIILRRMSMWGLVAIGEMLIMVVGEIDISVGSMTAFTGVWFSVLVVNLGIPLYLAIPMAIMSAMILSLFSGLCIVKLKFSAFIATIAMQFISLGAAKALTKARPVSLYGAPGTEGFLNFGQSEPITLSWGFFIFVFFLAIVYIMMTRTAFGRQIYATGDNKNAARLAGVPIERVKILMFLISGFLVGTAGVMMVAKEAVGNANNADGWELLAIAACAIGGISLVGGAGSVIGLLLGIFMMQVISNILILLNVNQHMQSVLLGIFMIASVFLDIKRRNKLLGKLD